MKPVSAEAPSAENPVISLTAKPVVDVHGLRYRYPDGTQALDGVDFQLRYGECVAVFGPNGSGKTTFILHLNGLLRGEGSLEVCGVRLDGAAGADALAASEGARRTGLSEFRRAAVHADGARGRGIRAGESGIIC